MRPAHRRSPSRIPPPGLGMIAGTAPSALSATRGPSPAAPITSGATVSGKFYSMPDPRCPGVPFVAGDSRAYHCDSKAKGAGMDSGNVSREPRYSPATSVAVAAGEREPRMNALLAVARRLDYMIGQITPDEFAWQDANYDRDSALGRELLFLIANDEWIRSTS